MTSVVVPADLLGRWTLARIVHDVRTGSTGVVTGTTELVAVDADTVRWDESGTMTFDGRTTPVSRTLSVRREATSPGADDRWSVHFADGRYFHEWLWDRPVEHACAPDDYRGLLAGTPDRWTVRWEARGPAKDLRLDSVLTPRP